MPQDTGRVAQVEDYDSDESRVVDGTVVQASQTGRRSHHNQPTSRSLKPTERNSQRRDAASDSGYSSHASAPLVSASKSPAPAPARISTTQASARHPQSPVKQKPILVQRTDSARSTQTISKPAPKEPLCTDPNCRTPDCHSKRNTERRYTYQPAQQDYTQYHQTPQYQYAPVNPAQMSASQAMPPPPRPRSGSTSRPRPISIAGGYPYHTLQSGPPPSASAYYGFYPQQQQPYLGSTPPNQMTAFPPASPVPQSPTSPNFTTYPGFPGYSGGTFSARQVNPNVPGLDQFKPSSGQGLTRTVSARRPSDRAMPGTFPDPESDSASTSGSEYSEDEEDDRRHHHRRDSYRDPRAQERRVAVVSQARRPSVTKKYYTETAVPTTKSTRRDSRPQEPLRRAPRSDTQLDYPSSSDINDSDRTQRAVVDRGNRRSTLSTSTHSSRRPSVSTTASSGRTKATSLSSTTDYSRVIIEGPSGRRTAYLSKDQLRRLQQQKEDDKLEEQRMVQEKVAAYQRDMSGGEPYHLTAENVKAQNRKSGSHSHSHVSRGKSSNHSGSKASQSQSGGIKIRSGDTVLHLHGDAKIEMRTDENGGAPQLIIGTPSGRDSAYQGSTNSRSSGSRKGRSRVSRRDQAIREEDAYDEGGYERQL